MTFDGIDLRSLSEDGWARLRGSRIALIFQDPKVRLNPVFSIGTQLAETIEIHHGMSRQESWSRMLALLREVGLPEAESKAYAYPHELSVGQAQRVMIAMALALEPELIIADEPTSALDATIQAQILNLLESQYQRDAGAVLLISHNLAIVAEMAKRVIVLYAGHVIEQASAEALFQNPFHPYTQGLIASMPQNQVPDKRMYSIPGRIPDAQDLPRGCRFHPRCDARKQYQLAICERETPELQLVEPDHHVRCWLYQSQGDHTAPFPEGPVATPDESMDAD